MNLFNLFNINLLSSSENNDNDNIDLKMNIYKINLFINHSILLNYFKSYINNDNNNQKSNCNDIKTILSKKFYNKLNINDKEVVLLDTKFIEQRENYRTEINKLLNDREEKEPEKPEEPEEPKSEEPEEEGEGEEPELEPEREEEEEKEEGEGEEEEERKKKQQGGLKEKNIKKSICEYINYTFYNYYVLLQAYYMFHNYKIVITNGNVNNDITQTNIFFKFIEFFIDTTNLHGENIDGENINIKTENETIDIKDFIDLLREDTDYKNDKTITDFKCSVRNNAIQIIKNGENKLFFNKTFKYQLLHEEEKKKGFNLYEMEEALRNSNKQRIVNYGIKKQIISFNIDHNNNHRYNMEKKSNLCYFKKEILNLKMILQNKITNSKNYTVNLENVKTDIKNLIDTYAKKKDELYINLIENKIFNISDTNFKYIEDVILYELDNKSLNTIKYNTEKIFYEFFIEFYKTLIKILDKIKPDSEEAKGGRKKIKTKRITKFKRRKTRRKTRRKN